jgi:hypothetical protein
MARQTREKLAKKKVKKDELLPLDSSNYKIIGSGIVALIIGYILLSTSPWDGFLALTMAPIFLVLGYCVIIPFGIMHRKKKIEPTEPARETMISAQS